MSLKQGQASGHLALRICSWQTLSSLEGGLVTLVPESGEDTTGCCGGHTGQSPASSSGLWLQPLGFLGSLICRGSFIFEAHHTEDLGFLSTL